MRCDDCNSAFSKGESVCAFSIFTDYGGIPYYPWEKAYIEIKE